MIKLQANLSEDEIIRDWSLSLEDRLFVRNFSNQYRLWVYLQICALRLFGQLLGNPNTLDARIIGYACKSLGLSIIGTVNTPSRDATRTEHKKLIFEYLSFQQFDKSKPIFHNWLKDKVNSGRMIGEQLVPEAEAFLINHKIALPTLYYLKREINSICSQHQEILFNTVYKQLAPALIELIDSILEYNSSDNCSWFQKFKEYPGSASISLLQDYLKRYKKLIEIRISEADLSKIPQALAKHLYQTCRYYDAWKIKRFKPSKRYTLIVVFLYESQKVMMDYLIQLHDQYISNMCRACKNAHLKALKLYKRKNEKVSSPRNMFQFLVSDKSCS
ncbi:DUF4158 domain-containing protein [Holosporaceae bacterium 'Namur']|nr:DUF4158 domain-containing protein [Holosporaceae bacterium 'Namur']